MKYIASVSGGKDSTAMFELLLEKNKPLDIVVFFDFGKEFKAVYNVLDIIKERCEKNNIEFVHLVPPHSFDWYMFEKPVRGRETPGYSWCGGICRWGTTIKNKTIKEYLDNLGEDYKEYIGIAYDEPQRIREKIYPLVDYHMTEKDCLTYALEKGYSWIENGVDLYKILARVSCWCCGNKNKKELTNIKLYLPEYYEKLKGMESRTFKYMKKSGPLE